MEGRVHSCISGTGRLAENIMEPEQTWINGLNTDNKHALEEWMKKTKINLVQVNGQRKYGGPPPDWVGEAPGIGSEVYIAKIPQDIYEDKLIPLFQTVGKLYEFRLMMTFSGLNRGFAYARYTSRRRARAASIALNGFPIQRGHKIVVCRSTEKCELLLSRIPCFLEQAVLKTMLQEITLGVEGALLFENPVNGNEMLAAVKYCTHKAAAMAKKKLRQDPPIIDGRCVAVDWLKAEDRHALQNKRPPCQTNVRFPIERDNTCKRPLKPPRDDEPRPPLQGLAQETEIPDYFLTPHTSNGSRLNLNYTTHPEYKKQLESPILPSLNQRDGAHDLSEHCQDKSNDESEMDANLWSMEQILQSLLVVQREDGLTAGLQKDGAE